MTRDQNAGQSHNRKNENGSFENIDEFKFLGTNNISKLYSGRNETYLIQGMLAIIRCRIFFLPVCYPKF
jgi:hypothetical protein